MDKNVAKLASLYHGNRNACWLFLLFQVLSQHLILRLKKIFAVLYVDHDWLFHV